MEHRRQLVTRVVAPVAIVATAIGLGGAALDAAAAPASMSTRSTAMAMPAATTSRAALHDAMRQLWEEHVTWTRLFIVSDVASVHDLRATTTRLLANQVDIGNAIRPFYGSAAADHLTALLQRHIVLAAQILNAAKAGDTATVGAARAAWSRNASEIAEFLHDANPAHWSLADLQSMMREHLALTLTEAVDELSGHYAASVADYDRVEREILGMADTLSNGIVAQFPADFR